MPDTPNRMQMTAAAMRFMHTHTAASMRINAVCGSLANYAKDKPGHDVRLLLGGLEATDLPFVTYAVIPRTLEVGDDYDPIIDHLIAQLEKLRACVKAKAKAKQARAQN